MRKGQQALCEFVKLALSKNLAPLPYSSKKFTSFLQALGISVSAIHVHVGGYAAFIV